MAFKRYTADEIAGAAQAAGIDPFIFDALYARESSRGTNPSAMRVRTVKQPQSGKNVLILGPFQLSGDTFRETALKHDLPANYDDPNNYLRVAAAHAKDITEAFNGDQNMIPVAWIGGMGANPNAKDENGTKVKDYANQVLAEANKNRSRAQGKAPSQGPAQIADNTPVGLLSKDSGNGTPSLGQLSDEGAGAGILGNTPDLQTIADTTNPTRVARAGGAQPLERDNLGVPLLFGNLGMEGPGPAQDAPPAIDHQQIASLGDGAAAYHDPTFDDETIERMVDEELSNRYPNA